MTGILQRAEDIVQSTAPSWTTIKIVPRGTPRFVDKSLRGTARYMLRVGSFLPNIMPDLRSKTVTVSQAHDQTVKLDRLVDGMLPGSLIQIDSQEIQLVSDVLRDTTTLQTVNVLKSTFPAGSSVDLFGEPMSSTGISPKGVQTIGVRGRFPVLVGDQLWIQADTSLLLSGSNYTVVAVQGYSNSLSLVNTIVVLDHPIPRDLQINSVVYLRGFPAYRSNVVDVPPHRRLPHPIGPFSVDYVSGRFTDGHSPIETLSLQTFDGLDGSVDSLFPVAVPKNQPVLRVPIHQSAFLFFHRFCGEISYRDSKFVFRNDDRGRCEIWADLVPAWEAPLEFADIGWTTRLTFASPTVNALYYRFEPNDGPALPNGSLLAAGSGYGNQQQGVTIALPAGSKPATRLRLSTSGAPGAEIWMDGWNVLGQQVERLQYGITAQQVGSFDWQAGSLQLKPFFRTLADLYTQLDVDSLDSGTLLL